MEFNPISAPKSAAKVVTVALPGDAAGSAADAFAALMRAVGFQFSGDMGLSAVEGQFLRARDARPADDQPRARPEQDRPKTKVRDPAAEDDGDAPAAPVKSRDETTRAGDTPDDAEVVGASTAQAATDVTATAESAAVVAIQLQIVVELPDGGTNPVALIDLDTMLAAAAKDPALAKALQDAFAGVLGGLQALAGPLDANAAKNLTAALAGAGIDMTAANGDGADAGDGLLALLRQIVAALRPLADQARPLQAGDQFRQLASITTDRAAEAGLEDTLDPRTADAARQAADLARSLGADHKVKINVMIDGRLAASVPFTASPFNRFIGYNPVDMRAESLANGRTGVGDQASTGMDARALMMGPAVGATGFGIAQASGQTGSQGNNSLASGRFETAAAAKPLDLPGAAGSQGTSQQGSHNAFGTMTGQNAASNATAQPGAAQPQPATPRQVIEQIKVHITRAAKAGLDRVTIQLRPEDLGRIEIKLEMFQDGKVKASIAADNPATLELLQKDARGMERALQDAGLRADASDLEFSLRGEDSEKLADDRTEGRGQQADTGRDVANDNAATDEGEVYDYQLAARRRGGVDTYA
jgi:hypothetical protein